MYTSFRIKNFRCFKDFSIDNLDRVNLIVGGNNVGKTALLEAIFLHSGGVRVVPTLHLNEFRGYQVPARDEYSSAERIWRPLFYNYDVRVEIEIQAEGSPNQTRTLRLRFVQPDSTTIPWVESPRRGALLEKGVRSTEFVYRALELEHEQNGESRKFEAIVGREGIEIRPLSDLYLPTFHFDAARSRVDPVLDAESYGYLEVVKQPEPILEFLKILEPRLARLAVITVGGKPILHGDVGLDRLIPLSFMGEGVGRLASLAISIATNMAGGVVLVDEIENGIYYAAMEKVWLGIAELARQFDVQLFATTHSFECIATAHQAFKKSGKYDFRLHRLDRVDEGIKAVTFDEDALEVAMEMGLEVR